MTHNLMVFEHSPYIFYEALLKIQGEQTVRLMRNEMNQCQAKMTDERERAANKVQKQKDKKKIVIS